MRIHKLSISIALSTALLGLSIACSKHPSDDTIAKDIQTKVAADPDTKDSDINVAANSPTFLFHLGEVGTFIPIWFRVVVI